MRRLLDEKEARNVRAVLRYLRARVGGWGPIAAELGFTAQTVKKASLGILPISANMVFRLASFCDVSIDTLLAGKAIGVRACPHCGHSLDEFPDEPTTIDDGPRPAPGDGTAGRGRGAGWLKLVK